MIITKILASIITIFIVPTILFFAVECGNKYEGFLAICSSIFFVSIMGLVLTYIWAY